MWCSRRQMSVRIMARPASRAARCHGRPTHLHQPRRSPPARTRLYNEVFKQFLHLSDFIGVKGFMFRTQTGELTLHVKEITVLSKALRPLPVVKTDDQGNVHDALTDPEQRYRMRYVDLVVNPGVKETFLKRTRIFNAMRASFQDAGYLEVDTPVLQPIPGGACAAPSPRITMR